MRIILSGLFVLAFGLIAFSAESEFNSFLRKSNFQRSAKRRMMNSQEIRGYYNHLKKLSSKKLGEEIKAIANTAKKECMDFDPNTLEDNSPCRIAKDKQMVAFEFRLQGSTRTEVAKQETPKTQDDSKITCKKVYENGRFIGNECEVPQTQTAAKPAAIEVGPDEKMPAPAPGYKYKYTGLTGPCKRIYKDGRFYGNECELNYEQVPDSVSAQ